MKNLKATYIIGANNNQLESVRIFPSEISGTLGGSGDVTNISGTNIFVSAALGSTLYISGSPVYISSSTGANVSITASSVFISGVTVADDRYVFTSSYHPFTASINGFTASFTASVQSIGDARYISLATGDLRYVLTSSYGPFTASIILFSQSVNTFSASHNTFSQSVNLFTASMNSFTASFSSSVQSIGDLRYVLTSSYGLFTASINGFTASFTASVQSIGDVRWVLQSIYDPFSASHNIFSQSVNIFTSSLNLFSQSMNSFTASFSSSVQSIGDTRYVLTSSAAEQRIQSNLVLSGTLKIRDSITNYSQHLILSSTLGSVIYISGVLNALDKTTSFNNLAPTTTNGDIIVFSGTTNVRKAIGANDTVLTADSTAVGGVKWASPSAASVNIAEAEICFTGSDGRPTRYYSGSITDAGVSAGSQIIIVQSFAAPTGKSIDENEMDSIFWRATPLAAGGAFYIYGTALEGPVSGNFKINYLIG